MFIQLIAAIVALTVGPASPFYDGFKVVEMNLKTDKEIDLVLKLSNKYQGDIWAGPSTLIATEIMVSPQKLPSFLDALRNHHIPYRVVIRNVQKIVDEETFGMKVKRSMDQFDKSNQIITDHFATYEEIRNWTNYLTTKYNFVSTHVYGKTYEGRDLKFVKLSTGLNRKAIIADGGIHGREWLSVSTLNYIIEKIIHDYTVGNPKIIEILSKYDFYFIPIFNPDGYAYSHTDGNRFWRKNRSPLHGNSKKCYGVDLNRNFDADFGGKQTSSDPCSNVYRGPEAFSEPETKQFKQLVAILGSDIKLYFSLHAYSQFWLVPYAFNETAPSDISELRRVADIGAKALHDVHNMTYVVGSPPEILYSAAGGSFDWIKFKAGVKYAYTLEVRPNFNYQGAGFIAPISEIIPTGEEVYAGFIATIEAIRI